MNCPQCQRDIPADAAYCIHCSAPLGFGQQAAELPEQPATGATIRLDPAEQPAAPSAIPGQPRRSRATHRRQARPRFDPSPLLFLIGLIFLFRSGFVWPGILVLFGLTHLVKQGSRGRCTDGLRPLLVVGGLLLIFWAHAVWPGILLLIIASQIRHARRYGWHP